VCETVEFELALALWLLSGLYKKPAWLAATACFSLFSCVTLYKGLTGAASCGCFGTVHVNPWITLFLIDLPAVAALIAFRPRGLNLRRPLAMLTPHPSLIHFATVWLIAITLITTSTAVLALKEPALVTAKYEVLEPAEWVGRELPILAHIDIKDQLSEGNWLVLLYHYDCPGCGRVIPQYEQIARDLKGNEEFLQVAFVAVPPFGQAPITENTAVTQGKMDNSKEWFVTTPAVALLRNAQVQQAWEEQAPTLDTILTSMATAMSNNTRQHQSTKN
jgi:hypothetical protein